MANNFKLGLQKCPFIVEEMELVAYASAVESLMRTMVGMRPDIVHVVGVMSIFIFNPGREHRTMVKWIMWYLRGTITYLLFGNGLPRLICYNDADWETQRSI